MLRSVTPRAGSLLSWLRVSSGEQRPQRLEAYIGGDHVQGDELLGASFYAFGGAQPWPSCFGGVGYGYSLRERNCSSCSVAW